MRRHSILIFLLTILGSCATTSRVDEIFKVDRNTQEEIWTFNVKDDKITEHGTLLYLNSYDKNNRLVETTKYLEDGRPQWDYYQIYTYRDNHLFEEYFFTVDNWGKKLIDGKLVNTYNPNGKLKQSIMFDAEKPKDDTTNVKWKTDFGIKYFYDANDSLIKKLGCSRSSGKCGITTYQYDTFQKRVTEVFINQEDTTLNTKDVYQNDNSNNLVYKVHLYRSSYDSTTQIYKDKKLIEEKICFKNGEQFKRTTFQYNNNGQLLETNHFNMQDKLENVQRHKYNSSQ